MTDTHKLLRWPFMASNKVSGGFPVAPWEVLGRVLGVHGTSLEIFGGSLGSLGVSGRPSGVLGQIGGVPWGRGFCHRALCHVYYGKYDIFVIFLGAPGYIGKHRGTDVSAPGPNLSYKLKLIAKTSY